MVYIAYCMVEGCNDFYIGHTICSLRDRCSGHRGNFKPGCYKKSALAYHIFNDHPEVLSEGLNNFAFGVLKEGVSCPCVPPRHALCVKTQGHRDAQGHPGTPRDAALEMP